MTKPLRIGLINQGGRGWMGGSMYVKNLILALSSLPQPVRATFEICLLHTNTLDAMTRRELAPHVSQFYDLTQRIKPVNFKNRLIWKLQKTLSKQSNPPFSPLLKQEKIDFLYPTIEPAIGPLAHQSCPWIPDFQHKYLPDLFLESELKQRDREFAKIAHSSAWVVLSSQTAEADFKHFYPESKTKTRVLHFHTCPSPDWYQSQPMVIQQKYHLPDRFFLLSGQFWQHKNHLVVLEALRILQTIGIHPTVVCTGHGYDHRKPEYIDQILQIVHTAGLAQQFLMLGLIPRNDQIQLMRLAIAVLQPSLFEGWSTVVEDARCLGKPMVLSDFPVHVEQNPPHSVFFEREHPQDLAEALAATWQTLPPGPNLEQEQLAQDQNRLAIQAFGYRFLRLAQGQEDWNPQPKAESP